MTPADLLAWRNGLYPTQRSAAEALGVTLATYQRMERGADWASGKPIEIDRRTALACAALAAGLPEWRPDPASKKASRTRTP